MTKDEEAAINELMEMLDKTYKAWDEKHPKQDDLLTFGSFLALRRLLTAKGANPHEVVDVVEEWCDLGQDDEKDVRRAAERLHSRIRHLEPTIQMSALSTLLVMCARAYKMTRKQYVTRIREVWDSIDREDKKRARATEAN